jgi:hypothetical protein
MLLPTGAPLQKPWIAVDLQAELAHRPPKTMDPLSPGCGHSGNQLQEKNPETRQNLCGDNSTYISKSQMMMRISSPLEEGLCTNDSPASKLPDLDTPVSLSASRYLPTKKKKILISTHNLKKQIYAAKEAIRETLSSKKRITAN